ncbi:MAG TPA: hypothetical protein VGQ36_29310, partial [Thermoanaerobaculia bacterium]|nr:hypothetical protein [Thermoanaerobaculia bacterium]
ERVLVPILFNGPGAYGSQWETRTEMVNASDEPIAFLPEVSRPLTSLAGGATASLSGFGTRPTGLVLFMPRGADVRFGSLIRDVSREQDELGTELRVVRERDAGAKVVLSNVPFDSRYRLLLRMYDLDGISDGVSIFMFREGAFRAFTQTVMVGPCADDRAPCNSNLPAYRSFDLSRVLAIAEPGTWRLEITANNTARRLWAFVTVTNNETQRVTVISPQ